jgi:hypothetical protein
MTAALSLWGAVVIVVAIAVAGLVVMARRAGRDGERAASQAQIMKAVEVRNAVEADVARDPDPAGRLRAWQRD